MTHPELLSPAGSMEGVRAAVQSGADAVYLGFGIFNARRGAQNFTKEEMASAISYCRARGVKTNITFNILTTDREREAALADARFLQEAGADAVIVQDLGLARLLRQHAPRLSMHASTQLTVHNLDGAMFARACGFSRVVLSRECTLAQIREISAKAGIETEVFVHGALCMCYSGQCYLSAVIGQRSGNRGLCAQPCRLAYAYQQGKAGYPLSLKDLSLADWLTELTHAGVSSFKIEGRMKRPEYAAVVTRIFADLLHEGRKPTKIEQNTLQKVFSRDGFTDGYLTGDRGNAMFGTKTDVPLHEVQDIYDEAARCFAEGKETPRVAVSFALFAQAGEPTTLVATDGVHTSTKTAAAPEQAQKRASTRADVERHLSKTGGTPFFMQSLETEIGEGLMLPASTLGALRREALDALYACRAVPPAREWVSARGKSLPVKQEAFRGYLVEVRTLSQITPAMLDAAPAAIYVPLTELAADLPRTEALAGRVPLAAVLPRILNDAEQREIEQLLQSVREAGVSAAVAGNVGHLPLIRRVGLAVYGDFGLNVTNSEALTALAEAGVTRQTLSFELRLAQIRDLKKTMETELLVYGYLPLMVFENCAIRRKTGKCSCKTQPCLLTDRKGKAFRLLPEYGCRNTMLNSQPLYLPRQADYAQLGVAYARLRFTTESPTRCAAVLEAYRCGTALDFAEGATKGLYFRDVT